MTAHPSSARRLALALAGLLALAGCSATASSPTIPPGDATATSSPAATSPGASSGIPAGCPTAQPAALPAGQTRTVTVATSKGRIVLSLAGALSPIAVGNFVALASCGYYDGVVFHRLVPGFVIQGGDGQFGRVGADGKLSAESVANAGTGGPGYAIQDEPVTTKYSRGVVAMARTAAPNSVGSQFFIVLDDAAATALAQANTYQIIGKVVTGMDVVDAIAAMPNAGDAAGNAAVDPLPMTKLTVSTP